MKTDPLIATLIVITFLLIANSCSNSGDCPSPDFSMISQYELDKSIVETNTTNVSTGIESVFTKNLTDSTSRAIFCQIFVDAARFYDDESGYFFIETLNNAMVVAHINHELIGTSRIDIQDEFGNYFIQAMVETVTYSGRGFVEYYRKNPATNIIDRKLSLVTSIPSANWFIGTGFYGDPPTMYYDNTEAHKIILQEITNTMSKGISGILKTIYTNENERVMFCRDFIDHIRFFDNRSGYFFINQLDGLTIAHGTNPELEGENQIDLQDIHGTYIIKDMIDIVEEEESGYYQYYWSNPATQEEDVKISYVVRIPDTDYFIGAGFYMD